MTISYEVAVFVIIDIYMKVQIHRSMDLVYPITQQKSHAHKVKME